MKEQPPSGEAVSLIIPTLRRPEHLARCLASLVPQTLQATEVLVGIRADDRSNEETIERFKDRLPVRKVEAKGVGVVGSMNSCLREANGDYIALLDDDIELPPNWIERMVGHLRGRPDVYAAGGRDMLQDHPEMRRTEPVTEDVGRFHWFGRITGNHHRGGGKARRVDILRGSNFMLRGDFLKRAGFEVELRGKGAQVNWELALALQARQGGARFVYDPQVEIIHHVGPRFDDDKIHRGGFDVTSIVDIAFNETLVILKHGRGLFRITGFAWQLLVGSALCPGVLHFLRQLVKRQPHVITRFRASMRGHLEAANHCLRGEAGATGSSNVRANGEAGQSPLRLAIVMPSAHPRGGSEEALLQLLRSQGAAGLVVGLLVFLEDGELRAVCEGLGVEVKVVKGGRLREPWKHAAAVLRIARLLKTHQIEMVLGWMTKAHIYSGIAGKLARVPAVYYQHGLPDDGAVDRLSRKIPAAGALGCSEFVAREQQARVTYPVLGVPVAADTQRFEDAAGVPAPEMRDKLGLAREGPLVGIVARLQRWKGVHVYAEAMAAVCAEIPGARGVIVGGLHDLEPDYEPWLRNRIKELGMTEKIRMVGVQRNIPDWMQAMDVVVHASEREPFGIVVVEAMSLGKPVVATLPGGPEEIITDGTDGRLVPWNRPDALAEAILKYLRDPDWARSVGERAKQRSREYSVEKYAERLGRALRSLSKEKS